MREIFVLQLPLLWHSLPYTIHSIHAILVQVNNLFNICVNQAQKTNCKLTGDAADKHSRQEQSNISFRFVTIVKTKKKNNCVFSDSEHKSDGNKIYSR